MKKIILMVCLALVALGANVQKANGQIIKSQREIVPGMRYSEYKDYYDVKFYVPERNDPYSRGLAGVASLLIPGLGQAIDGEWGRAFGFFASNVALAMTAEAHITEVDEYGQAYKKDVDSTWWLIQAARIALNIWSICDAVHVAKVKNMYYQDLRYGRTAVDFRVEPFLTVANKSCVGSDLKPAAGLSLRLSF